LGHLIPDNIAEEKKVFFQKNEQYNPQFKYEKQIKHNTNKKPDIKLHSLALKILESA
jgi:hypothetical protein